MLFVLILYLFKFFGSPAVIDENSPSLGWRRNVLLVEAMHSPDSGRVGHHARALESFCACNGIRLSLMNGISGIWKTMPGSTFPTPFTSPLITGSFPSSPHLYSPDVGPQRIGRIDMVPPLSLDGLQSGKTFSSPPMSPKPQRQLSLHVRSLHEKLQNLPQVGIIHLALQNDSFGSILRSACSYICLKLLIFLMLLKLHSSPDLWYAYLFSWQNDVFVVAEPGELADKFLQSVKSSLFSMTRNNRRKGASVLAKILTIADLVRFRPYFQVGNVVHRYIGRQTQVWCFYLFSSIKMITYVVYQRLANC